MNTLIQHAKLAIRMNNNGINREFIKKFPIEEIIDCCNRIEQNKILNDEYKDNEVIQEEIPNAKIAVLSGPSHAEEVSIAIPTVLVLASKYDAVLKLVQDTFMSDKMRIYTSRDVKGVELGGALKNIIAFCAGVAAGIGLGDNTFAALITRGLAELSRLGVELGGQKETLYGLSGLGDLIVTCLSEHSRNRKAGKLIGQGKTLEETKKEVMQILKKELRPEFINRIDEIIVFHKLNDEEIRKIVDIMIAEVERRLKEQNIEIEVDDSVKDLIAKTGVDKAFGARPLRRTIQNLLEDKLAEEILDGNIQKNKVTKITTKDKQIVLA